MGLLFVIDGPHCLYRACHAYSDLSYERDGKTVMVGGIFGFLQMIRLAHMKLADGEAKVVVAWEDPQRSTRSIRRMMFPTYKYKAPKEDEVDFGTMQLREFVRDQQKKLVPLLEKIGIPQAYAPSWEGDDVLATLAEELPEHDVVIFSGDKDVLSCICERVAVMRPIKDGYQLVTPTVWAEEHTVAPTQWAQVLALTGDTSDNIPGVRGIGPKTAEKLLGAHTDLEGVIAAAAAGQIKRFSEAITAMMDQLRLNLKLTTLNRQVSLVWTQPKQDEQEVEKQFRLMKFHSFTGYEGLSSILEMGVADW